MMHRPRMKQHVEDTILAQDALTVDGEAFCDVQQCLYWLCKQEILHMTNFTLLRSLCTLLGNSTLQRLKQSKNMTYESEQSMQEMIQAISLVLGKKKHTNRCVHLHSIPKFWTKQWTCLLSSNWGLMCTTKALIYCGDAIR